MIHQGVIEMYHPRKQWGFVRESDGAKWFFHRDNCVSGFQPELGVVVEFLIGPPFVLGKPDQAIDVRGVQS
jgi:hypothetical protein